MQLVDIILPMSGLEPRISGVGSDQSTNWASTTAQDQFNLYLHLQAAECVWGSRLYHSGRAHAFWSWVRIPPGDGLPSSSFLFLTLKLGKCKSGVKISTSEFLDTQIFSSFKRMGDSKSSKWCVLIYPNWFWQCHLSQLWKSSNFAFSEDQKAVLSLVPTNSHWHYWSHHCYYVNQWWWAKNCQGLSTFWSNVAEQILWSGGFELVTFVEETHHQPPQPHHNTNIANKLSGPTS